MEKVHLAECEVTEEGITLVFEAGDGDRGEVCITPGPQEESEWVYSTPGPYHKVGAPGEWVRVLHSENGRAIYDDPECLWAIEEFLEEVLGIRLQHRGYGVPSRFTVGFGEAKAAIETALAKLRANAETPS